MISSSFRSLFLVSVFAAVAFRILLSLLPETYTKFFSALLYGDIKTKGSYAEKEEMKVFVQFLQRRERLGCFMLNIF